MPASKLSLYDLLAPQFPCTFPDYIDAYLAFLQIDELHVAWDESAVLYSGRVSFGSESGAAPERRHRDPSGAVFEWEDVTLDFSLTIPRDGAAFINDAVNNAVIPLPDLDALFDTFGNVEQAVTVPTEYPGVRFRLELLASALTFHLGRSWRPGEVGENFRIIPSTDPRYAGQDVRFVLPKMVLEYEQGDDLSQLPVFRVKSWGNAGFDAPHDLAQGELVRMEPPIALHESGRWAFGVDQILIDLSEDHTPPEILQFFGVDEAFKGLFFKSVRLYYADADKDLGLNIAVNDLLISFAGEVSLEASADLLRQDPIVGFQVRVKLFDGPKEIDYTRGRSSQTNLLTGGSATMRQTGVVQIDITGGSPDYSISVTLDTVPASSPEEIWDGVRREARISPGAPETLRPTGHYMLVVTVQDSAPTPHYFSQAIEVTLTEAEVEEAEADRDGSPADRPEAVGERQAAVLSTPAFSPSQPDGYVIRHTPSPSGFSETITVEGGSSPHVRVLSGSSPVIDRTLNGGRDVSVDVADGASLSVEVSWAASLAVPDTFCLFFDRGKPLKQGWPASKSRYVFGTPSLPDDSRFRGSRSPSGDPTKAGADALRDWIQNRVVSSPKTVSVAAFASFEDTAQEGSDQDLSKRRREVALEIIASFATVSSATATGQEEARDAIPRRTAQDIDRVVLIKGEISPASEAISATATLSRPPRPAPLPPPTMPVVKSAPPPSQLPARHPPVIKRLSFRMRLERNVPVLIEFGGELDFETEIEERLRLEADISDANLALKQRSGASANPNPQDGVVDFKINVTYDTSTKQITETLTLGAAPGDIDGLLRMENPRGEGGPSLENRLKNIFGALLTFAPAINSAASALPNGTAGDWVEMGVSLTVPVLIGSLDVFRTTAITLYGGEMKFREFIPSGTDPLRFTDAGLMLDYAVEFGVTIQFLDIHTRKSLKVRYKAVGFDLHFENGITYQPIFDTSKGYEIDLSDPGLFNLPPPLGDLLKVLAARIARLNPLTLELDFAVKADLGVITVDKFKVKVPLDSASPPTILPAGVKVNIPATLIGSGFLTIVEKQVGEAIQKGIEGGVDVCIVPLKVRAAANLGILSIEDSTIDRNAIAVFLGLVAEFPTPIVLWATGLGIYGFSGLFAMHYMRLEAPCAENDSVSPALRWLVKAEGKPTNLTSGSGEQLWGPQFDRWSFGVGLILGTIDKGFTLNLRGMFVLELPGPRILIFVKVQMISTLPQLSDAGLTAGILGIVDLDLNIPAKLTIGVLADLEIEELISVQLPIEVFFRFNDLRDWHYYIGKIEAPASALVLNLVRARGYFMVDGREIAHFPPPSGPGLPGTAIATGIEASVLFGDEDVGLYLRVTAGAHLGVAFLPSTIFIVGQIFLDGELRLFIVSIEAHGKLDLEAPKPTLIHGQICGKVSFFFFSVGGCVEIDIGSGSHSLSAPPLVNGMYLQSRSPALTEGQGTDRPIDASLGQAVMLTPTGVVPSGAEIPIVPIDSMPVIQFYASPMLQSALSTFTQALVPSPALTPDGPGFINVGGGRKVRYTLKEISLDPPLSLPSGVDKPPATWRRDLPPGPSGTNTNIDLALFSRTPVTGERALERSTELGSQIATRWNDLCTPIAPAARVLWTFCGQPLGPSGEGWHLEGVPSPDPPGTIRSAPPPTHLYVEEPVPSPLDELMNLLEAEASLPFETPAKVIGLNHDPGRRHSARRICIKFPKEGESRNPFTLDKFKFRLLDARGRLLESARFLPFGSEFALRCSVRLEVALPRPVSKVELTLVHFSRPAVIDGINADGKVVDSQTMTVPPGQPETLTLSGAAISRLVVRAPQDELLIIEICLTPVDGKPDPQRSECQRALQLPYLQRRRLDNEFRVPKEVEAHARNRDVQWINLHTEEAAVVTVFLAVKGHTLDVAAVRELDADGATIIETPLSALSPQPISGTTTGLPADWLAAPWTEQVTAVAEFLARPEFSTLQRYVFNLKPTERTRIIQIRVNALLGVRPPHLLIGAIQVHPMSEDIRVETAEEIQEGEIATVTDYLDGDPVLPLLQPNETYTIGIRYDAETVAEQGSSTTETDLLQSFRFQTDASHPRSLDSYVLGTTPDHEDRFHFYEDPVKIVFNELNGIVQLFEAYGKGLRAVLRAADGLPAPTFTIGTLDAIEAQVTTPYYELLKALVQAAPLPCVGSFTGPRHGGCMLPIPLRPLMAYTLDIEVVPPDTSAADQATTPLYRRSFVTSRFPSMAALVQDLRACRVRHRALTSQVSGLPSTATVNLATDEEIQNALLVAGEQALPAASETGITVYWAKRTGASTFSPHVIMIDAAEPLWRTRQEPRVETVPNQAPPADPNFKRIVPQQVVSLEVIEQSAATITHFVRSPGGTRTLAFISNTFNPPAVGGTITLALNRPASTLYKLSAEAVTLTALRLTPTAPWKEDDGDG